MSSYVRSLITALIIVSSFVATPAFAHEGANADHLAIGMGIGEIIGLITGLVLGAASVLLLVNYRKTKSRK